MSFNTVFPTYNDVIAFLKNHDYPQCFRVNYRPKEHDFELWIGNQPYETYEEIIEDMYEENRNLKEKLWAKEKLDKAMNVFVKEQSKKVKHLFPLENTAGYGQLCDMVLRFEKTLKFYADHENYKLSAEAERADLTEFINMLDIDNGDKARNALNNYQSEID